jgi:hypothetical protein
MIAKPIGTILIVDDVATSGYHMEAIKALRSLNIPAAGIAWISVDKPTIGRPDWRDGRPSKETQVDEPEAVQAWTVRKSWRTEQGSDQPARRGPLLHARGD